VKALIGRKLGMSQLIQPDGSALPVTLIQAGPCAVTQIRTTDKDGYEAVQLGFGEAKNISKPLAGHVKRAKINPTVMREFRNIEINEETAVGGSFDVTVFEEGDLVTICGTSKGKGFAGTVKRHNFNTGPKTHGSMNYRKPGSIGSMYPQKVLKGQKMAGQMGPAQVTVKNLRVALVDAANGVIGVVGAVPGPKRSIVTLQGGA
jgi:large subunit ribosomal protein L3